MGSSVLSFFAHLGRWGRASCRRRRVLLFASLLLYALALLWPFTIQVPKRIHNGAQWTEERTLRFATQGLALTPAAPDWLAASRVTGRLHIILRARALAGQQERSARLLTLSQDTHAQVLVIGQKHQDLVIGLRTTCSGSAQTEEVCRRIFRIGGVFTNPEWIDIDLTIEPGRLRLKAGRGVPLEQALPPNALVSWTVSHCLALGNDMSGEHPWIGEFERAVVEVDGSPVNYVDPGKLELPPTYWLMNREPRLVPFRHARPRDMVINLVLYAPLGLVFALLTTSRHRHTLWQGILFIAAVSIALELCQLFVVHRNASVTDTILNIGGGAVAVLAVHPLGIYWRRVPALPQSVTPPISPTAQAPARAPER
jgi:hypothetical protein